MGLRNYLCNCNSLYSKDMSVLAGVCVTCLSVEMDCMVNGLHLYSAFLP